MKKQKTPRYTLVKGQFSIHNAQKPRQGPEPDGDTVRFLPDSIDLVRKLPRFSGRPPAITNGHINVRYEGIDALETHFEGEHQELSFARAARDLNLKLLGFTGVSFFADLPNVVESVDKDPIPGYVIANGIESNGRLLGLLFPGSATGDDGEKVFVNESILSKSVNAKLVEAGLVYVEPYDTMPISLAQVLRSMIKAARSAGKGMWPSEAVNTENSHEISSLSSLQELVMWPKLFRRLAVYFREGHNGLGGFDGWMREDKVGRDDSLRLPDGEAGNMHDTYTVTGNRLQLNFRPEDLLIAPDPPQ
jgi:endonuclease YncB( thermonuclease family)